MSLVITAGCSKKVVKTEAEGKGAKEAQKVEAVKPEAVKHEVSKPQAKEEVEVKKEEAVKAEETAGKQPAAPAQAKGIEDIFFDFDRFSIRDDAKPTLEENARYFKEADKNLKVVIEGHCDERGTSEYNIALGERRAKAAQKYLIDLGIDQSRISIISYGKERPFCADHNEQCWQENRRDHFVTN
ncbi:MAG: peptidoglycan-associated lipoprotein Pal [Deltaproteobacteria bacterium]|nr:peptidoglycan-associated lipoprotein Pal [Deltaproteobacteria bacterium]